MREHFRVDCAADGFEAIEKIAHNDYDTIVLDLTMPRANGMDVLHYLEREKPRGRRNVILMTANVPPPEAATAQPVSGVLTKPFDIRNLVDQVRGHQPR